MADEVVEVEMCCHYTWEGRPKCKVSANRPGLKCHSRRQDCNRYKPSYERVKC